MDGMRVQRKRVRFSYDEPDLDEQVVEYRSDTLQIVQDNTPETSRARKLRFPKGKKESQNPNARKLDKLFGEEDGLSTDPRVAATERAVRRNQMAEQLVKSEDSFVLNDIAAAEEDYEFGDEEDEDAVPLEPFNLKQEREEGYFDADGNYVEYRLDRDINDAWLDSVKVDTRFAKKHLRQDSEEEDAGLSREDISRIKSRIADALLPGETVLQALRRLKGSSKERNRREKMPEQTKAVFDHLTEDAMKLMDNGDYDVYNETKETFQQEAEGYESIAKAKTHSSSNGIPSEGHVSDIHQLEMNENIFADDYEINPGEKSQVPMPFLESDFERPVTSISEAVATTSVDMFGDDEKENFSDEDGIAQIEDDKRGREYTSVSDSGYQCSQSGYVFDTPSGYYYNQDLGYYYDSVSGLYCNASSGKWFSYEEESGTYVEVS